MKAPKTPADTRPISILSAISKFVEKLVQHQLVEYLETYHNGMMWEMLHFTLVLSGAQIQATSVVRNLGVTFDTHLKFTEHIYMVKTCTGSLITMNHARQVLPKKILPCLVQVLAIFILRYYMSVNGT